MKWNNRIKKNICIRKDNKTLPSASVRYVILETLNMTRSPDILGGLYKPLEDTRL